MSTSSWKPSAPSFSTQGSDPSRPTASTGTPPLVSVVIPAYNHEPFVAEAIESVLSQTYPRCELIVINDGSTDGTDRVVRDLQQRSGGAFRYVSKNHEGLVPTLNRGLEMTRGKYFAQFGSDDVLLPDSVSRQVERLEKDPRLGLVCADAYYLEGRDKTRLQMLGDRGKKYFRSRALYRELLLHNFIINLTVMYRRESLLEVGGFDDNVPYFEDWDAVLRVAERYPIGYINAPLGYWRLHATNTHKRLDWMFAGIRATVEKHFREGRLAHRRWFRRHVFSRIYYRYGKQLLDAGDVTGARGSISTALGYNPFFLRAYPKLLQAAWKGTIGRKGAGTSESSGSERIW
jgi:alpha-1,3-rhamnosyltransferase